MEKKIRIIGDPILRRRAEQVTSFDTELEQLAASMLATMRASKGIGLAAPQVGVSQRMIVVGHFDEEDSILTEIMVNPRVIDSSGSLALEEGCLSVPGFREMVTRPERVTVEYQDLKGNLQQRELEELEARVFQHECDHLDGVLFVDRISPVRRGLLHSRLKKLSRDAS